MSYSRLYAPTLVEIEISSQRAEQGESAADKLSDFVCIQSTAVIVDTQWIMKLKIVVVVIVRSTIMIGCCRLCDVTRYAG